MATCGECLYYEVCPLGLTVKGKTGVCLKFKNKADVVEVKHGEWKEETKFIITDDPDDDGYWRSVYICSECGREEWQEEPYCHCGAKMDGERREGEK